MAASGVNVKMGVSGVAQFKQNMQQAKQSVKTLDAQLALTEKQFKATGDSESYMTEKAELLKSKLEQQKSVVANAEKALEDMQKNGVDRASKAYQDMYRSMLQAKGEMIDTEAAINGVTDASDAAADTVTDLSNQLGNINTNVSFQNITDGLDKITGGMEKAARKAFNLGKKVFQLALGAGAWADELNETAEKYGISAEDLQRYRQTADIIDTDVDTIISAQDKLAKNRSKGGKEFMGALAALGIDPTGKDNLSLFWEAGEALKTLGDEEDQVAYANALFGKSWRELLPLFNAGREEYDELNASWNVVSEEQLKSLGEMDDEYQKLQNNFEILKMQAIAEFAEPLSKLMTTLNEKMGEFTEWLHSEEGQEAVQNVVGAVRDGLEWIVDNSDTVLKFIAGFGLAWVGLKTAGAVTTVLELINGIKGLTSAGSAAAAGSAAGASWASAFSDAAMKASPFLNWLFKFIGGGSESVVTNTTNAGAVLDWFTNETPVGRQLSNWIDRNIWGKEGKFADEDVVGDFVNSVLQNSENFDKDLAENVVTKPFVDLGKNNILFWDNFWGKEVPNFIDQILTGGHHEPFDETDWGGSSYDLMAAIEARTAEMEEGASRQAQSNSEMTEAAQDMKTLPQLIKSAVENANIKVYIDGQQASSILTPYAGIIMGQALANAVK